MTSQSSNSIFSDDPEVHLECICGPITQCYTVINAYRFHFRQYMMKSSSLNQMYSAFNIVESSLKTLFSKLENISPNSKVVPRQCCFDARSKLEGVENIVVVLRSLLINLLRNPPAIPMFVWRGSHMRKGILKAMMSIQNTLPHISSLWETMIIFKNFNTINSMKTCFVCDDDDDEENIDEQTSNSSTNNNLAEDGSPTPSKTANIGDGNVQTQTDDKPEQTEEGVAENSSEQIELCLSVEIPPTPPNSPDTAEPSCERESSPNSSEQTFAASPVPNENENERMFVKSVAKGSFLHIIAEYGVVEESEVSNISSSNFEEIPDEVEYEVLSRSQSV